MREAWIERPDPVVNNSQNPVGYTELPEEAQYGQRPCGCGCGAISTGDFLPGHDVRAMQKRVRRMFNGSALEFLRWIDRMAGEHGLPILAVRNAPAAEPIEVSGLPPDSRPMPSLEPYDALLSKPGIGSAEVADTAPGSEQ